MGKVSAWEKGRRGLGNTPVDYAKIQLVDTRSPLWRRASATARGAAISVLAYCADLENSGVIDDAKTWEHDDWWLLTATSLPEINEAIESGLCEWRGDALVCNLYDHGGHASLMTKRAQGKHGIKGGRPRNPMGSTTDNPMGLRIQTHVETHVEKGDNPQKSPDQSIPDQEERAPARDDSALALPSRAGQRPSASEKDSKQREFIARLGGELDLHGKDLLPEWQKRFHGHTRSEIESVFREAKPAIRLPSNFKDALKQRKAMA